MGFILDANATTLENTTINKFNRIICLLKGSLNTVDGFNKFVGIFKILGSVLTAYFFVF